MVWIDKEEYRTWKVEFYDRKNMHLKTLTMDNFKKYELDALVVIGGDGSFTGADIFSREFNVPVIGIPGTIDND